eukprot:6173666-Pleurochrysis_carterae.AAC.1
MDVPFVASLLVTTAGDAATALLPTGTASTPTLSNGTLWPPGRERNEVPAVASIFSPTSASVARLRD